MAILAVMDHDAEVGTSSGALVVRRKGSDVRTMPLHEVEEVHLYGGAEITAGARNLLLAKGIDTLFLTMDGRVRGRLLADEGRQGDRRLAQYAAIHDGARRLTIARSVVAGKIANQRRVLMLRQRHLKSEAIGDALAAMRSGCADLPVAESLDVVRGIEGMAAKWYFGTFPELLRNAAFSWDGRNRRPPRDPVNACLSYGYTLLVARVDHAVRVAGLDPYLGVLHEVGRGKAALALDLAEILRPMVDGLVLTLINRGQLGPEDFAAPDQDLLAEDPDASLEGAIYLTRVGRAILLRAWATRLAERSPHPTLENDWSVSGLLIEQARALGRALVQGEVFVPAEIS